MKKWLLGLLTAMMAVSLAACTPTTEKKQETTTTLRQLLQKVQPTVLQGWISKNLMQ